MTISDSDISAQRVVRLSPDITLCQTDLPLDWYQDEFKPYAEEFLALPDRRPETILGYLDRYVAPARDHFGDELLLLAHFYMGGEIVKLVEHYGGAIADSYQLALQARNNPQKKVIVESAVHFMAESIAILAHDDQDVWITNPKAGCTMEMGAKDWMVLPIFDRLTDRLGEEPLVVAYMNTSGRLKALAGRTGGAVCTSSNAHQVVAWALEQDRPILFVPDEHLGRNTAHRLGIDASRIVTLPPTSRETLTVNGVVVDELPALPRDAYILWGSECSVHTMFTSDVVRSWKDRGWTVYVHPECTLEAVLEADGSGSTAWLWNAVSNAEPGAKIAIGTEGHFVRNLAEQVRPRGIEVAHLADIPGLSEAGCGCATMSRNDPPHLAGTLDLLRQGRCPDINRVLAGDIIDDATMARERMSEGERSTLITHARASLEKMIEVVEGPR